MIQQDKELSLKDLCARLPYRPKVFYEYVDDLDKKTYGYGLTLNTWCIDQLEAEKAIVKPYLRPMSSMTDEEMKQYGELCDEDIRQLTSVPILHPGLKYKTSCHRSIIWLLKNHFDFMGLIPKGLAIAVTEENNPYRESNHV